MPAAPGIVTSGTGAPNAVVQIQPGMTVQPVVLVDQAGQYLATSGSAVTAGYLATQTTSVYVAGGAAIIEPLLSLRPLALAALFRRKRRMAVWPQA